MECGPLEELDNSDLLLNNSGYGEVVIYQCHHGYYWPNTNTINLSLTCNVSSADLSQGEWETAEGVDLLDTAITGCVGR